MKTYLMWIYRAVLFVVLFGLSALPYGGNLGNPLFDKVINGMALLGIFSLIIFYFRFPALYKVAAWLIGLGVIGLVLESKYEYDQLVYSYFVIKRFAYCGLALFTYVIVSQAGPLKIDYVVYLIILFFVINMLFLGQIFTYNLTSETRPVYSNETLYLVIPCVFYLVKYMGNRKIGNFLGLLFTFAFVVFLLHRSVISAAVIGIGTVAGLSLMGKLPTGGFPMGRTFATFIVLFILLSPALAMLSGSSNKVDAFLENIGGIFNPKEDETGSWRLEQSEYYVSQIPEKPILGWRYEGYDRGEIMENEDFPEKGTIIHSQYIDQLYNYGAAGLALNLFIILGTLLTMYVRNPTFTIAQTVLFGYIMSGLIYAVSYQLPVYYWGFVGVGMFYALHRPPDDATDEPYYHPHEEIEPDASPQQVVLSNNSLKL